MSEKRFEDDGVEHINNYNYTLLDTYYEFDGKKIIEWNKHSSNVEYTDLERITERFELSQLEKIKEDFNLKDIKVEMGSHKIGDEYRKRIIISLEG